MTHFIITIDGPSASGKSTLAKKIAQRLGINYLDSGAFYRSIAAFLLLKEETEEEEGFLSRFLEQAILKLEYEGSFARYFLNGVDLTPFLRNEQVAMKASRIAKFGVVRKFVNQNLQAICKKGDFIADGRDLGSKVFPKADVKFFLTASIESRAKRRELEQKTIGIETSFEKVLEQLLLRDQQDSKRKIDPLVKPDDAIFIDTTTFTTDEVCEQMLISIKKKFIARPSWYRVFIGCLIRKFFKIFFRLQVFGEGNAEKVVGGLVYANHSSYLDAPLLLSILGPNTVFVASKRVIEKNIFIRWITSFFSLILVDEKNMPRDFFRICNREIHKGCSVVIFPEGMRSMTGEILPFKDGLASIIIHCKITEVLPIYLGGVYNAWPKDRLFPTFWKKITVLISKPLCMTEYKEWGAKEPRNVLTEYLKKRLVDLEKQYKDKYE